MDWIMKPNRVPWCSIRRDKIFAGYGLSKIVYAGKKFKKKKKIISTHSNVKGTYRPWVRIWVLLRKFYKKKREREREKKIYTAVTCKIGKRQKTLPTFFSYEWQIALQ